MARRTLPRLTLARPVAPPPPPAEVAAPATPPSPVQEVPAPSVPSPEARYEAGRAAYQRLKDAKAERYWEPALARALAKLEAMWRAAGKDRKGKKTIPFSEERARKDLGEEAVAELVKEHDAEVAAARLVHRATVEKRESEYVEAAAGLRPPTGPSRLWQTRYTHDYSTTGLGAAGYARGRANMDAKFALVAGFQAKVIPVEGEKFEVWVEVAEGEFETALLNLLTAPMVRDFVKASWKEGLQPRVFLPGFPPGYEDQVGLDYFGNEKTSKM